MDEIFKAEGVMDPSAFSYAICSDSILTAGYFQNGEDIYVLGTLGEYDMTDEGKKKIAADRYENLYTNGTPVVLPLPTAQYKNLLTHGPKPLKI